MPSLEARLARNEVIFRSINDRIRELAVRLDQGPDDSLSFICECADETCVERLPLTMRQYDDVRAIPARFVVVPGHEVTPLVERVVFRSDDFVIVRKVGIAADVARELTGSDA
ncbi:MAG: hypothetical protein ACJ734_09370 [Gaiellaceae bacterium]